MMVRVLGLGIWICVCTLASAYGVMTWQRNRLQKHADAAAPAELKSFRTRNISVPMLEDGQVEGYVVAKFEFSVEEAKLKSSPVSPESLVTDEAFKLIYSADPSGVKSVHKRDLQDLTENIEKGVNKRAGEPLVGHVLIDSWSYLSKEDVVKQNGHVEK